MRNIFLVLLFLAPSLASAQPFMRNDGAFAPNADSAKVGNSNQQFSIASVDPYGRTAVVQTDASGNPTAINGRQIVSQAAAADTWQACTSPMTGTAHTQIKAAVASNRIYVTAFNCENTADVNSNFYIEEATTPIYVGSVAKSSLAGIGSWRQTFPTPLRLASATALQVVMVTTGTSTTCCASGYISTN